LEFQINSSAANKFLQWRKCNMNNAQ
jgi:hypothetical protein